MTGVKMYSLYTIQHYQERLNNNAPSTGAAPGFAGMGLGGSRSGSAVGSRAGKVPRAGNGLPLSSI